MPTHCSPRVPARLLAAAVALLLSSPATAAQQTETSIHGSVVDASDGKPIAGALISLLGTSFSAESNQRGGFVFHRVPSATYTLVLRNESSITYSAFMRHLPAAHSGRSG